MASLKVKNMKITRRIAAAMIVVGGGLFVLFLGLMIKSGARGLSEYSNLAGPFTMLVCGLLLKFSVIPTVLKEAATESTGEAS